MVVWGLWLWVLGCVLNEDILWSVNIGAELEVVDLSDISLVEILSNQDLEKLFPWWKQIQLLHDTSELLNGDVAAVSSIIILELWLDEDSLLDNFSLDGVQQVEKALHLIFVIVGCGFGVVDNTHWVSSIEENVINVGAELIIVDESILHSVLGDELLDLLLSESDVQSTKACSELYN